MDSASTPGIVEDRAFADGELVERTLDYYAQADDGTVYYLGEHVSNIENGKVVDHHGTWLFGKDTDVPGVAMPARSQGRPAVALRGRARGSRPSPTASRRPASAPRRVEGSTRT